MGPPGRDRAWYRCVGSSGAWVREEAGGDRIPVARPVRGAAAAAGAGAGGGQRQLTRTQAVPQLERAVPWVHFRCGKRLFRDDLRKALR